jgi:hypothetical protein
LRATSGAGNIYGNFLVISREDLRKIFNYYPVPKKGNYLLLHIQIPVVITFVDYDDPFWRSTFPANKSEGALPKRFKSHGEIEAAIN